MHVQRIQQEDGFIIVTVVIMFLVVLGMMGMATYMLSRGESVAVSNKAVTTQHTYSLIGGAEFALAAYQAGGFQAGLLPFPIGGIEVYADTVTPTQQEMDYYDINRKLIVNISGGGTNEQIIVYFRGLSNDFENAAIYIEGENDVTVTGGGQVITGMDPLPGIDQGALYDLAQSQGQVESNNMTITSNYGSSFYQSGSTPSVTWVPGNLTVSANRTAYGIFVVGGNITLGSGAEIVGVVYFLDSSKRVNLAGSSSVSGGIVGYGDVQGSFTSRVHYNQNFMTTFDQFRTDEEQEIIDNEYWVFW